MRQLFVRLDPRNFPVRGIALLALLGSLVSTAAAAGTESAPQRLRIVGGLGGVNQYTRHEEPFWTRELPRLSGGKASAEIVPFDRAGIRGQEMLRLVRLGAVPFGTALLNIAAVDDADLMAADLAALNPDFETLVRTIVAFRPYLGTVLHERYGIELLAVYIYPAQVTYCKEPLASLAGLERRRVRVGNASQADYVAALRGIPVQTAFSEIVANVRSGNVDCAITGTMSAHTIGLDLLTSHVHTMPLSWGIAVFVANGQVWQALPGDLKALLKVELPKLERAIWAEAARETGEGIACNTGSAACTTSRRGELIAVRPTADDERRRREILTTSVLPNWSKRCGPKCADVWRNTIGPAVGVVMR